jgi:hypothetical protein
MLVFQGAHSVQRVRHMSARRSVLVSENIDVCNVHLTAITECMAYGVLPFATLPVPCFPRFTLQHIGGFNLDSDGCTTDFRVNMAMQLAELGLDG